MTRSVLLPAALVLGLAAVPTTASAVSRANRVEGDPDTARVQKAHSAPPADTSGPHYFDKAHDGSRG